jgi:dihydropteroate synthase
VTGPLPPIARPGRCVVMGILNVTPDSFSDGGRHDTVESAVAHGLRLAADGADYVDVGGESTRPGADRVDPAEELRRVPCPWSPLSRGTGWPSASTRRGRRWPRRPSPPAP